MKPFIVIKYYMGNRFIDGFDHVAQWAKVTAGRARKTDNKPYYAKLKDITNAEARALIAKHGLTRVIETEDGLIYDKLERNFQSTYFGQIYTGRV